ncbi:hypothetical protein MYX65_04535 [Acidobacteria bacterium AH-259-L09]|nr:hypothetical protein [Acidobacteria bacterium AH-259-L09]
MNRLINYSLIIHRFSSRSGESAGLVKGRPTGPPEPFSVNGLLGRAAGSPLRYVERPTEGNTGRADDFVAAVENL